MEPNIEDVPSLLKMGIFQLAMLVYQRVVYCVPRPSTRIDGSSKLNVGSSKRAL